MRFCLTTKHLETKLNYQKHIKFYEIHKKKAGKKISIFFYNFKPFLTLLGPTTSPQLKSSSHPYRVIL